ncbi:LuxR C-terminal-related transcriptional regulator [Streptomyces sp. NBC_01262]|uniref:LuxR C-terminal-related transcriptional regulator n=1 Tax=Streptomyces sp. NBC_01262 TaxID=2903803 RepID=UPI002E36DD60|nr:LuxR C-terminal-related transcriptional regulator [Streptomyces sp. NBC_01262]
MSVSQQERQERSLSSQTALVGRDMERVVLAGRLRDAAVRLVTLTGPGGVGKSRLAAEVARGALGDAFAEVRFLDMTRPGAFPAEAAKELRARDGGPGRTLMVLDGCDLAASSVSALLDADPRLVVLATCLEPLRVYGERLLPVAPLGVPTGSDDPEELRGVPSVELFVRRARDADPGFALTAENAAAVAEICVLLEGLPLALELAAGRLRLFPPQTLLARLRQGTTTLSGGPADAPERHRSLGALAEWSCAGLGAGQRTLLEELAVYERGFGLSLVGVGRTREAELERLLDRSLVTVMEDEHGEPRFAVPEPIRSYCRGELEESGRADAALDGHADRYRRLVAAVEPRLAGTEQERWLKTLAAEGPNVLAALGRLYERGEYEAAAGMVVACRQPWLVQGRQREGLDWCDRMDSIAAVPEPLRVRLVDMSGSFAAARGEAAEAVQRHRRALALCKRTGDRKQSALVSAHLGAALLRGGDPQAAQAALGPALTALESLGAAGPAAEAATALAAAHRARGDRRRARELLERAQDTCRRLRDNRGLAGALRESAALAEGADDLDGAGRALRESLRLYGAIGERSELPATLDAFALLLLRTSPGQQPRVVRLIAAADALRTELAVKAPDERWADIEEALTGLRARLQWNGFATAWAEGLRLTPSGAVAEALSAPVASGRTAEGEGEQPDAAAQSLTPRQVQVAMLVAEGMTNRQIAARLTISEWTVVNHVRQVMRRLNCTSRVQVAWSVGRWP